MKKEIKTFSELLDKCGGAINMAPRLNRHQTSIERWARIGMAEHNFPVLNKEYGITRKEFEAINATIKADKEVK